MICGPRRGIIGLQSRSSSRLLYSPPDWPFSGLACLVASPRLLSGPESLRRFDDSVSFQSSVCRGEDDPAGRSWAPNIGLVGRIRKNGPDWPGRQEIGPDQDPA